MNIPIDQVIRWLEEDNEFRTYAESKHKTEYEYYRRFRAKNGTRCPIARAAAKRIFTLELADRGADFAQLASRGL